MKSLGFFSNKTKFQKEISKRNFKIPKKNFKKKFQKEIPKRNFKSPKRNSKSPKEIWFGKEIVQLWQTGIFLLFLLTVYQCQDHSPLIRTFLRPFPYLRWVWKWRRFPCPTSHPPPPSIPSEISPTSGDWTKTDQPTWGDWFYPHFYPSHRLPTFHWSRTPAAAENRRYYSSQSRPVDSARHTDWDWPFVGSNGAPAREEYTQPSTLSFLFHKSTNIIHFSYNTAWD